MFSFKILNAKGQYINNDTKSNNGMASLNMKETA